MEYSPFMFPYVILNQQFNNIWTWHDITKIHGIISLLQEWDLDHFNLKRSIEKANTKHKSWIVYRKKQKTRSWNKRELYQKNEDHQSSKGKKSSKINEKGRKICRNKILPSPSLSKRLKASLNSEIWSSVSWSAIFFSLGNPTKVSRLILFLSVSPPTIVLCASASKESNDVFSRA